MTDNEIQKALECCSSESGADCECCPAKNKRCDEFVMKDALDLINRYGAKIEALQSENRILSENADNAFQDGLNEARELYSNEVKNQIKAEAIKEFAERLKKEMAYCSAETDEMIIFETEFDDLVKEMTEGKKGDRNVEI